jgi:hypothetical protein
MLDTITKLSIHFQSHGVEKDGGFQTALGGRALGQFVQTPGLVRGFTPQSLLYQPLLHEAQTVVGQDWALFTIAPGPEM